MALIERISQMKQQGVSDPEIIRTLREEGNSPREINEAISQSTIKNAVSSDQGDMQQSIMSGSGQNVAAPPEAAPTAAAAPAPQPAPAYQDQGAYADQGYQDQGAYADQGYQDQGAYADQGAYPAEGGYQDQGAYYQQAIDTETIREIASQVTEESLSKLRTRITEITKLKSELKFQIQNIDNRLTKIESTIAQLQSDILKKIGDYGENIENISKEMKATQDSFSKLINPTIDKKRAISPSAKKNATKNIVKNTAKKPVAKTTAKSSSESSGASFEDYFR